MKIIKLDTIASTNSFLKEMSQKAPVDNFTVVSAKEQTAGKGQIDKKWISEANKNLTFSILLTEHIETTHQKYINLAVSVALINALKKLKLSNLSIKWPNDIMAGKQKIAGILIETFARGKHIHKTIIGIGLNVNQTKFPKELPKATSLALLTNQNFALDSLLKAILDDIKSQIDLALSHDFYPLEQNYAASLFMKNKVAQFMAQDRGIFSGKIIGISETGNLLIEDQNRHILEFGINEIRFA